MKKTLLIAAAALAASVISSEAQVYSQNVVGYVNVTSPVAGKNYLITVPFAVGASNGVNEVFGSSLADFSSILLWNGNGYTSYVYDTTDPAGLGAGAPVWYLSDDFTPAVPLPTVTVGKGFFLVPSSPITNTFVGAVAINVGTSNTVTFANAGINYLISPVVPYGGAVTNGGNSGGGANLNNLPDFSSILFWNGNGYTAAVYDSTDPAGLGAGAPLWYKSDDFTPYVDPVTGANVPSISVGQGFFLVPAAPYSWTVGL